MKQKYELTAFGIKLDAFAAKPDPEELAHIIACMSDKEQAEFLICFSAGLHNRLNPVDYQRRIFAIREAIAEDEAANRHGYGSDLIRDLQIEAETVE